MTDLIKQRLVGIIIVVIAGIVFLPDLLDGKKSITKESFKKLPVRPDFDQQPIITEFPKERIIANFDNNRHLLNTEVEEVKSLVIEDTDHIANAKRGDESAKLLVTDEVNKTKEVANEHVNNVKPTPEMTHQTSNNKDDPFVSQAWILQLGSFKHKENVVALTDKLKESGFDTFIKPVETQAGTLSKVFIGPEMDKSELEKAQFKLKELTGLDGKITRFSPVN